MYRLILSSQSLKQLKNIKQNHQSAVKLAIEDIKENPDIGKPLTRELKGRFSYRVGLYRIIYKVNQKDKIIHILNAGHRATVYE
ncbi:MAG: type II toxin-antitoxin system RelE/ParE family toxin [Candidatus Daviesbacteria bacterium]|nr:type II toxin-antitoxin system RelE/ParE family toxin [Candidatus Daviesbacteria bacterium]